ncbi:MAG: ferrous iron transport protein B [Planctomycetaceae bacterium]|nr:ferrous iron transport protein B [Planctomycetaceae bacterium]
MSVLPLTVAVIGNPNTGKSTLFSALTGMAAHIGNYPGVTVEKKIGRFRDEAGIIQLVDLPGTYSLAPRSLDEMVSVDVLLGRQRDVAAIDAVLCIVDASNLDRHLYLVSQVLDLGLPVVLVLNFWDVATQRGTRINVDELSRRLGVAVIPCEAHRRVNVEEVRKAIRASTNTPERPPVRLFPEAFSREVERLRSHPEFEKAPDFLLERLLIDVGGQTELNLTGNARPALKTSLTEARQRLAEAGCRVPTMEARLRYAWIRQLLDGVVDRGSTSNITTTTDRLDRFLTHRVWGLLVFCVLMVIVFQALYTLADPMMGWIEERQGELGKAVGNLLPIGPLRSLIVDGAIAGVGGVLVFLPQIVLLFLFIAVLEDCGYMARAAFLMDRLMTRLGLSGKSFVPLMSSFACAIPGVMATRTIENSRDRMVTILIAPLMSCSARLPVYLLMISAFVPERVITLVPERSFILPNGLYWNWLHGLVLFGMMSLGALVAIPVAWLLRKTYFKGETPPFVLELPNYKWPSPRIVLSRVWSAASSFLMRAGSLILATSILIWAASYFPGNHEREEQLIAQIAAAEEAGQNTDELRAALNQESEHLLTTSFLGRAGQVIEPVVKPAGWDWRIGVGVIASFPAREIIVATLGTIYSLGKDVADDPPTLIEALRAATWPDGRPVYTLPVAVSIMVFFALCAQCAATLMVIRRETNSWFWPVFAFSYMTLLAYAAAVFVYQVGTALGG